MNLGHNNGSVPPSGAQWIARDKPDFFLYLVVVVRLGAGRLLISPSFSTHISIGWTLFPVSFCFAHPLFFLLCAPNRAFESEPRQ